MSVSRATIMACRPDPMRTALDTSRLKDLSNRLQTSPAPVTPKNLAFLDSRSLFMLLTSPIGIRDAGRLGRGDSCHSVTTRNTLT
jgi:hypothetical protein